MVMEKKDKSKTYAQKKVSMKAAAFVLLAVMLLCAVSAGLLWRGRHRADEGVAIWPEREHPVGIVQAYCQKDARWAEDKLGRSVYRMKGSGCLTSCIASALSSRPTGAGIPEEGLSGSDLPEESLSGSGIPEESLSGSGISEEGLSGSGIPEEGLSGDGFPEEDLSAPGPSEEGLSGADLFGGDLSKIRRGACVTAGELNQIFSEKQVYNQEGDIVWGRIEEVMPDVGVSVAGTVDGEQIEALLDEGRYPIVKVKVGGDGASHWVLIVGSDEGGYLCMDPLKEDGELVPLSRHGGVVYRMRCVYWADPGR